MPQELQVLKCFSCDTFQVQIVKKIPKWICKLCGEKQSTIKIYFKGSGKDCRTYVQNLNKQRIEKSQTQLNLQVQDDIMFSFIHDSSLSDKQYTDKTKSNWTEFLTDQMDSECSDNHSIKKEGGGSKRRKINEKIFVCDEEMISETCTVAAEIEGAIQNSYITDINNSVTNINSKKSSWTKFCTYE
ncbi:MRN complex-interacting protein [Agrilus planipennis]|uniref:MRN complex-interacting protein n=1 Tax=Agrilus planipennis TaxID=224129 RepID=A0A1W4WK82_AGRPL|nr:MRN complex-interacting protein [Agrilus planipennis]